MSITAAAGLEVKNYSEASGFVSKEGVNHGIRIWKGALIPDEDCGTPVISRSRHKAHVHGQRPPASRGLPGTEVLLPRPLPTHCSTVVTGTVLQARCGADTVHGDHDCLGGPGNQARRTRAGAAHHSHLPAPNQEHLCCRPWGGTGRSQHHGDPLPSHLILALYDVFCAGAEQG